ncbi:MinD/ParA family ATP-binding protein [Geoglobus acetivorans]|uniref:Flagellar synthesis regulator FleN n=1 Tax=Geoglobus acetivorans TaxID=565033 RepID=A0A0A7GE88_GEOAI|nr:Flagellar synthesis regulator FleN [Geoglobus acetivorans]
MNTADTLIELTKFERKLRRIVRDYFRLKTAGARVLAFPSGKGGVGKTTVTMNLASALALRKRNVIVIDANLALPNVHTFIEEMPEKTLTEYLMGNAGVDEIKSRMKVRNTGFDVIPAKSLVDVEKGIEIEKVRDLILALKPDYDYILIDSSPGLSKYALYPAMISDTTFIVSAELKPAYIDAIKVESVLSRLGVSLEGYIINMVTKSGIKYFYNKNIFGIIPYDGKLKSMFSTGKTIFHSWLSFLYPSRNAFLHLADRIVAEYPPMV